MHATTIHEPDLSKDSDDLEAEDDRLGSRKVINYFERAATLVAGKIPNVPRPYRTFALSTVAFHLNFRPTMTNMTINSAAELYELPDFRPAIADYMDRHFPDFTHMIGGR